MRAIVIKGFGGLDSLVIETLPDPEPKAGHAVIMVKAFGINHAETHMRKGEWAEDGNVSGIECVGVVKECPGGEFAPERKSSRSWVDWEGPSTAVTPSSPILRSQTLFP